MSEPAGLPALVSEAGIQSILSDERLLSLVCQPIVDLPRGLIVGYEALARFELEVPAGPDLVFAAARRFGLGEQLEALVVRRALALRPSVPVNCFLSINLDPEHLTSAPIFDLLANQASLGGLVFELTEQRQIVDERSVARCMIELRKRGAFFAVDDAGAGYSGLQQILALRPQFLKLDRALVTSIHLDEAKRAMIEMLGELAQRLDAWIVAEGIEHPAELHALAQLGVPLGQGFCLARPAPPWAALSPGVASALDALPKEVASSGVIDPLIEACTWCGPNSNWPEGPGACVRLEATGRPIGLRSVDENGERIRDAHEFLWVKRGSSIAAVALRCTARPEPFRWDPIVCIDELGHFEGLIHMHMLMWALASRESDPALLRASPLHAGLGGELNKHH